MSENGESGTFAPSLLLPPLTAAAVEIATLTRRAESVNYWIYEPNKGAPVFFAVAFAVSGLWQLWQG